MAENKDRPDASRNGTARPGDPGPPKQPQPEQGGPRGASDNPALQNFGQSLKHPAQQGQRKAEPDLGRGTPGATQHGQQMFEKGQPGQAGQGTTQGKGHQGQQAHSKSQSSAKRTPGADEH